MRPRRFRSYPGLVTATTSGLVLGSTAVLEHKAPIHFEIFSAANRDSAARLMRMLEVARPNHSSKEIKRSSRIMSRAQRFGILSCRFAGARRGLSPADDDGLLLNAPVASTRDLREELDAVAVAVDPILTSRDVRTPHAALHGTGLPRDRVARQPTPRMSTSLADVLPRTRSGAERRQRPVCFASQSVRLYTAMSATPSASQNIRARGSLCKPRRSGTPK